MIIQGLLGSIITQEKIIPANCSLFTLESMNKLFRRLGRLGISSYRWILRPGSSLFRHLNLVFFPLWYRWKISTPVAPIKRIGIAIRDLKGEAPRTPFLGSGSWATGSKTSPITNLPRGIREDDWLVHGNLKPFDSISLLILRSRYDAPYHKSPSLISNDRVRARAQ